MSKSAKEDIQTTLSQLMADRPLTDPKEVLSVIVDFVTTQQTDPALIKQAVTQTLLDYENKSRLFLVAVAQAQSKRILNLIKILDRMDDEILAADGARFRLMDDKDFVRQYATIQTALLQSLDYTKKIVDMKMDHEVAKSQVIANLSSADQVDDSIKILTPQGRDTIRKVLEAVFDGVEDTKEVTDES